MPVPNSLTRILDKQGTPVSYDLSKVQNAILHSIIDAENISEWEAKERSLQYAQLVSEYIYKSFYSITYLTEFYSKIINSFAPSELEERLKRVEFASRLTALFLLHLENLKLPQLTKENTFEFVAKHFNGKLKSSEFLDQVTHLFVDKITKKKEKGIELCDQFPSRDFIQDSIEQVLKDIGEVPVAEAFMLFRQGKNMVKSGEISESQFTHDGVHRDRVRQTLLWNIKHDCDSVFKLNDWSTGMFNKDFKELMGASDKRFYDDIKHVVVQILSRAKDLKLVVIAGPSCSNKTTTTAILALELAKHGLKLKQLNIDDYFFDLSEHPKDQYGDYDYEMPEAIDIKLLNENLRDLIAGQPVMKPKYNFKTGMRDGFKEFQAGSNEIILIDCLHGLYSPLTSAVPPHKKFKIYTESTNMLRGITGSYTKWTDVRLAKRMIRDVLYRGHPINKTLGHWAYVRKGELKHIIPYIYSVDAVLNAGLPYELPILKTILQNKLPTKEEITELRYQGRLDAYIRGVRLSSLFDTIIPYEKLEDIDRFSPIREFIGGSGYDLAHNE